MNKATITQTGTGLDADNQKAISILFASSISGFAGTVREEIKTALAERP